MSDIESIKKNPDIWIEENKGLLWRLIFKFSLETSKFSKDDLWQEAYMAAWNATSSFDEKNSKAKLSTYIYIAVKRALRDFVRRNKNDLYVTVYQQKKEWKEKCQLESDSSDEPTLMSQPMPLSIESPMAVSLDAQSSINHAGPTIGDMIPSGDMSVIDTMIKDEQVKILQEEIALLPDRERDIIYARYWNGHTLEEIAHEQGCTRQRIDKISKRAMGRLADKVKKRLEDELLI